MTVSVQFAPPANENEKVRGDAATYAPLRRDSMARLEEIAENGPMAAQNSTRSPGQQKQEDVSAKRASLSTSGSSDGSSPRRPILKQMLPGGSNRNQHVKLRLDDPLPHCIAESQVIQERPSLRTRLLVCLLSGATIVFCLTKLFWKV